jgi:threonine dehydrogenase-like Zn-dependent dehydrogenase
MAPNATCTSRNYGQTTSVRPFIFTWKKSEADVPTAITTRLLHNFSAPMLLKMVEAGKIDTKKLITHTFKFGKLEQAYTTFKAASANNALKVIIDFE